MIIIITIITYLLDSSPKYLIAIIRKVYVYFQHCDCVSFFSALFRVEAAVYAEMHVALFAKPLVYLWIIKILQIVRTVKTSAKPELFLDWKISQRNPFHFTAGMKFECFSLLKETIFDFGTSSAQVRVALFATVKMTSMFQHNRSALGTFCITSPLIITFFSRHNVL